MTNPVYKKNRIRRFAALAAAAVIMLGMLSGCSRVQFAAALGDDVLLTVDDEECTLAEAVFRLMEVKDRYEDEEDELFWERSVDGLTMDEYVKESVQEEMIRITAAVIMADNLAVTISEDELEEITEEAEEAYDELADGHDLSAYGITLESVISLYTKLELYNKVYDELTADAESLISEADTKAIEVNYVEIPLEDGEDAAEALRQEIKGGTDFGTACTSAGYEAVLEQVLTKGSMPDEFENVAYDLTDGELSEVIETEDCYYLIECVEDYLISESVANNNQIVADARQEAFNEAYTEFSSGAALRFNENVWEEISVRDI